MATLTSVRPMQDVSELYTVCSHNFRRSTSTRSRRMYVDTYTLVFSLRTHFCKNTHRLSFDLENDRSIVLYKRKL